MESPVKTTPDAAPASVGSLRPQWPWLGLVALVYLAFALPVVFYGRLTADEGWYLLASVNIAEGERPYRDFLFTQTPLLPYVYGVLLSTVGASLVAARLVSMLFGLGGLLCAMAAIQRRAGTFAAALGGAILVLDLAVAFDASVLKTQPLTLLLGGLAIWLVSGTGRWFEVIGSVAAMTLAVLARLSMVPALVCFQVYWLAAGSVRRGVAWGAAVASAGVLAACAGFFWAGGNAFFGVYEFHRAYFAAMPTDGRFFWLFVKGFVANQMPIVVAGLAAFGLLIWRWRKSGLSSSPWASELRLLALLGSSYLGTTLLHATRTVTYPTYQTSNVLFVVVFAGIVLGRLGRSNRRMQVAMMATAVLRGLAGMPWQEYVVNLRGVGAPGKVAEATAKLNLLPRGNGQILTLAPELAVSTQRKLIPGYEMGAFSYFPRMDDTRAEQVRVVNAARLERDLTAQRASILALTTDAMYVFARGLEPDRLVHLITSHYNLVGTVEGYGQYSEVLYLFAEKTRVP